MLPIDFWVAFYLVSALLYLVAYYWAVYDSNFPMTIFTFVVGLVAAVLWPFSLVLGMLVNIIKKLRA